MSPQKNLPNLSTDSPENNILMSKNTNLNLTAGLCL